MANDKIYIKFGSKNIYMGKSPLAFGKTTANKKAALKWLIWTVFAIIVSMTWLIMKIS